MDDLTGALNQAHRTWAAACEHYSDLIERLVATHARDTFGPTATTLEVLGEYNDEGALTLRSQRVLDAAGHTVDPSTSANVQEAMAAWDDFCDEADPHLDTMAELTGETWLGEHQIDLTAHG